MKINALYSILCVTAILCLSACNHKDVDFNYTGNENFTVNFDWQYAPDAEPGTMSLYMFPVDSSATQRYEFTDKNGGVIRAHVGNYTAVCFNSFTDYIEYSNTEKQSTFELTTTTTTLLRNISRLGVRSIDAPRAEGTEEERIAFPPDALWSAHNEDITVVYGDTTQSVTFYPKRCYCIYTVEIINCQNLKYVLAIDGSLSGMAGGWIPAQETLTTEKVTIPFSPTVSEDYSTITAEFNTFGNCPDELGEHTLMIYVILGDGNKYSYSYDVTEQIHSAPDPYNVHISLDGLPLPQPIVNGGGYNPGVDGWSIINVDVNM